MQNIQNPDYASWLYFVPFAGHVKRCYNSISIMSRISREGMAGELYRSDQNDRIRWLAASVFRAIFIQHLLPEEAPPIEQAFLLATTSLTLTELFLTMSSPWR